MKKLSPLLILLLSSCGELGSGDAVSEDAGTLAYLLTTASQPSAVLNTVAEIRSALRQSPWLASTVGCDSLTLPAGCSKTECSEADGILTALVDCSLSNESYSCELNAYQVSQGELTLNVAWDLNQDSLELGVRAEAQVAGSTSGVLACNFSVEGPPEALGDAEIACDSSFQCFLADRTVACADFKTAWAQASGRCQ